MKSLCWSGHAYVKDLLCFSPDLSYVDNLYVDQPLLSTLTVHMLSVY